MKKTKKFKENRPENCHVHDRRVCANRVKIDELSAKVWRLESLTLQSS